jgi:hypothetical protein
MRRRPSVNRVLEVVIEGRAGGYGGYVDAHTSGIASVVVFLN